jgi:DNA-directed RNA polymerase alpha subunit
MNMNNIVYVVKRNMFLESLFQEIIKLMGPGYLSPKEYKILEMRNGLLEDRKYYTLEEVGKEFGVTRERIRQIESKAMERIRNFLEKKGKKEETLVIHTHPEWVSVSPSLKSISNDQFNDVLKTRVENLPGLSVRTVNALHNACIRTLGGLVRKSEYDLWNMTDGLGLKGLGQIREAMAKFDCQLKESSNYKTLVHKT